MSPHLVHNITNRLNKEGLHCIQLFDSHGIWTAHTSVYSAHVQWKPHHIENMVNVTRNKSNWHQMKEKFFTKYGTVQDYPPSYVESIDLSTLLAARTLRLKNTKILAIYGKTGSRCFTRPGLPTTLVLLPSWARICSLMQ